MAEGSDGGESFLDSKSPFHRSLTVDARRGEFFIGVIVGSSVRRPPVVTVRLLCSIIVAFSSMNDTDMTVVCSREQNSKLVYFVRCAVRVYEECPYRQRSLAAQSAALSCKCTLAERIALCERRSLSYPPRASRSFEAAFVNANRYFPTIYRTNGDAR